MPLEDITNLYRDGSSLSDISLIQPPNRLASSSARLRPFGATPNGALEDIGSRSPTPALTVGSTASTISLKAHSHQTQAKPVANVPRLPLGSPGAHLKRALSDPCGASLVTCMTNAKLPPRPVLCSRVSSAPILRVFSKTTSTTAVSSRNPSGGPVSFAKPGRALSASDKVSQSALITTRFLKPQTYKVSRGQLVVLPSGSLLVDFREGERRKGRSGKEVLIVTSDGSRVRWLASIEILGRPILR